MKNISSILPNKIHPLKLLGKQFNLSVNEHLIKCSIYSPNKKNFEILSVLDENCINSIPLSFDVPFYFIKKNKNIFSLPKEFIPISILYQNGKNNYSSSYNVDEGYSPRKEFLDKVFNNN